MQTDRQRDRSTDGQGKYERTIKLIEGRTERRDRQREGQAESGTEGRAKGGTDRLLGGLWI